MSNTIQTPWLVKTYSAQLEQSAANLKAAIDSKSGGGESFNLVAGDGISLTSAVEGNVSSLYINNSIVSGSIVVIGNDNNPNLDITSEGVIIGSNNEIGQFDSNSITKYFTILGQHNDIEDNKFVIANGYSNKLSAYTNSMLNGNANSAKNIEFSIVNGQANKLTNIGYSLVAGNGNKLSAATSYDGNFNIVFGNGNNVADGNYDYVYGHSNSTFGSLNNTLGAYNIAAGALNFVVGSGHNAVGTMNMLLGTDNSAVGGNEGSILMGNDLIATAPYQIIMGAANDPDDVVESIYDSDSQCYNDPKTTVMKNGTNYVYPMFVLAGDSYPKNGGNRNSHTIYKDGQIMLRFDNHDYAVNEQYPMTEVKLNADYFARASAVQSWVNSNSGVSTDINKMSAAIANSAKSLDSKIDSYSRIKTNSADYDNIVNSYSNNSADYSNIVNAVHTYSSYFTNIALSAGSNMSAWTTTENGIKTLWLSAQAAGDGAMEKFLFSGDATINVNGPTWDSVKQANIYTLHLPTTAQTQVSAGDNISVKKNTQGVVEVSLSNDYSTKVANDITTISGACDGKVDTSEYNTFKTSVETSAGKFDSDINSLMSDRYKASALYTIYDGEKYDGLEFIVNTDGLGTYIINNNTHIHSSFNVYGQSNANKFVLNEGPNSARAWQNSDDWSTMIKPNYSDSKSVISSEDIKNGLQIQVIQSAAGMTIPTATSMFTWVVEPVEG